MSKVVAASGGFDPLTSGHIEYLEAARKLGDKLIVILNKDQFLLHKKGSVFMPYEDRREILKALGFVDDVIPCIDEDDTVKNTLSQLKPNIFAKGGDRKINEIPETPICRKLGIEIVDGLGEKIRASSDLIKKLQEEKK